MTFNYKCLDRSMFLNIKCSLMYLVAQTCIYCMLYFIIRAFNNKIQSLCNKI